jgi:hypothetical protein
LSKRVLWGNETQRPFLNGRRPGSNCTVLCRGCALKLEQVGEDGGYRYWKLDDGDFQIAIHDAKSFSAYTYPAFNESNVTHLYFNIESQAAFINRLNGMSIEPYTANDVVITVVDPDGRKVTFATA